MVRSGEQVKRFAIEAGFDVCGIASPDQFDEVSHLNEWVKRGFHADMKWLERSIPVRLDISQKLNGVRSVVVVAKSYYIKDPRATPRASLKIARYAWGQDYHRVLKKPLRRLAAYIQSLEKETRTYISLDSGPVLEKAWAVLAGIGWRGKHSLVINPDLGSWFFIGIVATTLGIEPDKCLPDLCGSCDACLRACPTQAIAQPYVVDSRRCIAYHTVENRNQIPEEIRAKLNNWVFGCDECQNACPWNHNVRETSEKRFRTACAGVSFAPQTVLDLTVEHFNQKFAHSSLRRIGLKKLQNTVRAIVSINGHISHGLDR